MAVRIPQSEYDCNRTLAVLKKVGESTTYEIADITQREVPHTLQTLRYLERKGKVIKVKPGVRGRYHVPAVWKAKPHDNECKS